MFLLVTLLLQAHTQSYQGLLLKARFGIQWELARCVSSIPGASYDDWKFDDISHLSQLESTREGVEEITNIIRSRIGQTASTSREDPHWASSAFALERAAKVILPGIMAIVRQLKILSLKNIGSLEGA